MIRNDGYASFTTFAIILSLSGMVVLLSSFLFSSTRSLDSLRQAVTDEKDFMALALTICQELTDDSSPEADSLLDDIWKVNEKGYSQDFEVELTEMSSRLNPNFDNLQLWKLTNLKKKIKSSFAFSEWETNRINQFGYGLEEFEESLQEDDWENLYTLYSYININSAPLEVIEGYLRQTGTAEDTISSILSRTRKKRKESDHISQQELIGWLSDTGGEKSTILSSLSKMNINFVDPLVLEAVLSYPWNGETVDNYLVMKNNILNARRSYELTEEQLRNLLTSDEEIKDEILRYLGDTSWFWKLVIQNDKFILETIICRIPSLDDDMESTEIQIVNKRFIRKEE